LHLQPVITVREAEAVYDYCWYPHMNSGDQATCCFLSSTREHPVHLWDAYTGLRRCTYAAFDHMDQICAPNSVAFNLDGTQIYCGFKNLIQIFHTDRPGRDSVRRPTTPNKRSREGQKGLVSAITFNPDRSGMYAVGTFSGSVGLYDEKNNELLYLLTDLKMKGVTQIEFSPDGRFLYSASRKSDQILCWDIRNTGAVISRFARDGDTNQRLGFSLDPSGQFLSTGDQKGQVLVYDACATSEPEPLATFEAHKDAVSSAMFHPYMPLLATCSGQRRRLRWTTGNGFAVSADSEEESDDSDDDHAEAGRDDDLEEGAYVGEAEIDSSVRLWKLCVLGG
ncbi:WD40-repeat-containing domain protein, partial [Blyttiomyces helicus]